VTPEQILQEGLRLHQAGRLAEAQTQYRQLLAQQPKHPEALHYLGLLAYQAQQYETAARLIGESVAARPDDPAACNNLGNALAMLARGADAEAAFRRALALDAEFADAWFNLGNLLRERQPPDDAIAAYRRVVTLRPNHVGALNNLANLLLMQGRRQEAAEAWHNLGNVLQDVGRTADAERAYRQSQAIAPNPGVEVKLALLVPAIAASVAEIDATRERLSASVDALAAKGVRLQDPLRYAGSAIFYTPYHGRNDRDLRRRIADFHLAATPALAWCAPHCAAYAGPDERIRIGFISRYFHPQHPMTKLYGGIVEHFDRRRFDVSMFRFDPPGAAAPPADTRVTVLPDDPAAARKAIGAARLDALFYTDIGMEPATYFLAFARLAPVQCVTFGHPVTTGIPNVDYFLSAREMETGAAQDHYTETLIRLSTVPTFFRRPSPAAAPPTRRDLGLPDDARLYFCAQNVIKYHPDFDAVLGAILRRDPRGLLVLINSSKAPQLGELLLARLQRTIPDVAARIAFLPFLDLDALLGFLQHVDAILDTPVFGGGTTSLEMFAVDAPVVTWPGTFARSRITHALYRQMGIEGLTAASAGEYVDIALRLAGDPAWKLALQRELREKKHLLYENAELVRELERFFGAAIAAATAGRKLDDWAG
jgi:protein O-GlcNAc transferase